MLTLVPKSLPLDWVVEGPRETFYYFYDMEDYWEHKITLSKVLNADPSFICPVCVAGKGACPPEDCGGVWGYGHSLGALKDPSHEDYEMYVEWLGTDDYDPEDFDLNLVNKSLSSLKP